MRLLTQKNSHISPRRRRRQIAALSLACSLCLTALVFVFEAAPASGKAEATIVTVVLGTPKEHTIVLSTKSVTLATGTTLKVTFDVSNKGKKPHSFEVCTKATASTSPTSCDGTATKVLAPGKAATLTITLTQGSHEYLSTVAGDAKAGMKGGLSVSPPVPDAVKVTLGSPDEYEILLSENLVGLGPVTFNVTNRGKKPHSFQICLITTYAATKNSCLIGQQTKTLKHGQSATLTATLSQGIHEYLSTVAGDAKRGMKGGLDVEPIEPIVVGPTPVDTGTCADPTATTTVTVTEVDYNLTVSPTTVPCGTITFNIANNSDVSQHNFSIVRYGTVRAASMEVPPGGTTTLKVMLNSGAHAYQSDDPVDATEGMTGTLTVTP